MYTRSITFALSGFLYGLGLAAIGLLLTGAGHGSYLLLGLASAPLCFLGFFPALFGPPLIWSLVGGFLGSATNEHRWPLFSLMFLHYLGVLLLPFDHRYFDWKYFEKVWMANPGTVLFGFSLYAVGQVLIWYYTTQLRVPRKNSV